MNVFDNVTATAHAVCESSELVATTAGHIFSLKCHAALDNGKIVSYGAYQGNEVFASKAFAAGDMPLLVLTPPTGYSGVRGQLEEKYFYNAKDEIARAYELHEGDIWTISADAFSGTPEVGKWIDATYTVKQSRPTTGFIAQIIDKVNYKNGTSYRLFLEKINATA